MQILCRSLSTQWLGAKNMTAKAALETPVASQSGDKAIQFTPQSEVTNP